MSSRELIVLGTSAQVPTVERNQNGFLLRWDAEGLLFDPGEGTQRQLIYAEVTATAITRVLITHFHGDHCLGLAGMSQRISLDRVPHPVHVYFPASGQAYYDRLRRASIFHDVSTQVPHPVASGGRIHEDALITIEARPLDHVVDTFGYRMSERDRITMLPERLAAAGIRGPAIGQLQKTGRVVIDGVEHRADDFSLPKPGQSVAFVMDTRPCAAAVELARDVDLLVAESTYLESEAEQAHADGHMTAADAGRLAREAGARMLVLGHFHPRYDELEPFLEEASRYHPNVVLARDTARIPIPRRDD
jgi:ribonuclease Z